MMWCLGFAVTALVTSAKLLLCRAQLVPRWVTICGYTVLVCNQLLRPSQPHTISWDGKWVPTTEQWQCFGLVSRWTCVTDRALHGYEHLCPSPSVPVKLRSVPVEPCPHPHPSPQKLFLSVSPFPWVLSFSQPRPHHIRSLRCWQITRLFSSLKTVNSDWKIENKMQYSH